MTRDLYVRLRASTRNAPRLRFKLIGDDQLSGGVGGWEQVDRKLRRPAIVWTKTPLRVYKLPLRLDGFTATSQVSVEQECRVLMGWGQLTHTRKGTKRPPTIALSGNVRVPLSLRWVITGLDWGDYLTSNSGRRIRQDVTVTLTEYIDLGSKGYAAALKKATN